MLLLLVPGVGMGAGTASGGVAETPQRMLRGVGT